MSKSSDKEDRDDSIEEKEDDEEEEEEEDFKIEDIPHMDPNSNILAPVQKRISEQLKKQMEGLLIEIKEQEEENKRLNEKRETIGVELYARQQQLASLHEKSQKMDENLNTIRQIRTETETKKDSYHKLHDSKMSDVRKQKELQRHYKLELDKLNSKLQRVAKRDEEVKNELSIKRRKTYKTEEEMMQIEKEKKAQDMTIDSYNYDIKQVQQNIHDTKMKLKLQKNETKRAKIILAETKTSKEELDFRKKQLRQQWKSSLVGMQRRDETLEILSGRHKVCVEKKKEIENEIMGYISSVNKEKDLHEVLTSNLMSKENTELYLDKQIQNKNMEIDLKHEQFSKLKGMLSGIEVDYKESEISNNNIQKQVVEIQKEKLKYTNSLRKTEQKKLEIISDQTTFKKGTLSTKQVIEKTLSKIRDREIDIANYENEIARIKIDILQTNSHNEQLSKILNELENELNERSKMINKYKMEIKKKNDEISKKQKTLDKLNREMEKLVSGQKEENFGPLEAEIHNLQREILGKEKENEQLNKNWIRQQSELVELMNKIENISDEISNLSAKRTILYQKHKRLEKISKSEKVETGELKNNIKKLHDDMIKLNSIISKHNDLQKKLSNENFDIKNSIMYKIKERERETKEIDGKIKGEMTEKINLRNELLEIEKQIMFWEKKIELQKEIQTTLDPEIGQDEIKKMRKEIHVMEQRLEHLKREIKKKVNEMQRAVSKRAIINLKGISITKRKVNTKASVKREVNLLREKLKKKKVEKKKKVNEIKIIMNEADKIGKENEKLSRLIRDREMELDDYNDQIKQKLIYKELLNNNYKKEQSVIMAIQKGGKVLKNVSDKVKNAEKIEKNKNEVFKIIGLLGDQFPHYKKELKTIESYLKSDVL